MVLFLPLIYFLSSLVKLPTVFAPVSLCQQPFSSLFLFLFNICSLVCTSTCPPFTVQPWSDCSLSLEQSSASPKGSEAHFLLLLIPVFESLNYWAADSCAATCGRSRPCGWNGSRPGSVLKFFCGSGSSASAPVQTQGGQLCVSLSHSWFGVALPRWTGLIQPDTWTQGHWCCCECIPSQQGFKSWCLITQRKKRNMLLFYLLVDRNPMFIPQGKQMKRTSCRDDHTAVQDPVEESFVQPAGLVIRRCCCCWQ